MEAVAFNVRLLFQIAYSAAAHQTVLSVAVAHLSIVTEQHVQVVQVYAKLVLVQQNVFHVFLTINLMVQHVAVFQINMKTIKLVLIVLLIA
jgi:hypothetical protein